VLSLGCSYICFASTRQVTSSSWTGQVIGWEDRLQNDLTVCCVEGDVKPYCIIYHWDLMWWCRDTMFIPYFLYWLIQMVAARSSQKLSYRAPAVISTVTYYSFISCLCIVSVTKFLAVVCDFTKLFCDNVCTEVYLLLFVSFVSRCVLGNFHTIFIHILVLYISSFWHSIFLLTVYCLTITILQQLWYMPSR